MAPIAKRKRADQPEEITFDSSAREEYLTGFHKRKQARIQNAKEIAAKKDKEDKVLQRKQLREQRKEDLQRHVTEFNAELKKMNVVDNSDAEDEAQDGEWKGIEETAVVAKVMPDDEEYVDEDKYTTVTVEAMEDKSDEAEKEDEDGLVDTQTVKSAEADAAAKATTKKKIWSKDGKPKAKKKTFRYESKIERQKGRQKQKAKNQKAKERRTGGK